ncbi:MAG TPA: hypothetical protein VKV77_00760 [Methylovirgula sp.]|nr:hypothetical protein [Methylovirgula sp.]
MQRLDSLRRILAVQRDLRRIAELRLAALNTQLQTVQANEERLVSYLDEDHVFTPAYTKTITDRLRALGRARKRFEQERDEEAERLLQSMRRVHQTERLLEEVAEDWRRLKERRELDEAIEAETNRRRASLP